MTDTTARTEPRAAAIRLIRATALDEAAHHGGSGLPPANWEMYQELTATLESWYADGALAEDSLLLTEWLATELVAYVLQMLDQDRERLARWLLDQGDRVCQTQQHPHPAGPTAVEIISVIAASIGVPDQPAERLVQIAVPYLSYLRPGHEVEDAREVALTFALWAGENLARLMAYEADRVDGYLADRAG
ncbi:hypothetical protein BOQ63_001460 (plasmid) [Streptomyces viridifaciens]|nr:hypothetical protein BOQ63_001460 [Streptomyces viridifaciens]